MEATSAPASTSRALNIAAWVASALGFVLYTVVASPPKLMRAQQAVEGFGKLGYSEGFLLFIGACEFLGGIALLIPRLAFWSACGLIIIMFGAIRAHVSTDDVANMGGAVVGLLLCAFIAFVRRKQALFLS